MAKVKGTVRKLGLEGGVWALMGDDGEQYHLVDAPASLQKDGLRVEVVGDTPSGASIAMVGSILKVRGFEKI